MVGGWPNAHKPGREYAPLSAEAVEAHLVGNSHAGLYPLLPGDVCRLLVCDFDGPGWTLDALAYLDAARSVSLPVALERSRSGNGASGRSSPLRSCLGGTTGRRVLQLREP